MAVVNIKASFPCGIEKVWETVTSLDSYAWRSDLDRIEILSVNSFMEYDKKGYATFFTVTKRESLKRWEFDMENDNIRGRWTGVFSFDSGITTIEFTEDVTAKKLIMKPFVKSYLKKQQSLYVSDLKKALER